MGGIHPFWIPVAAIVLIVAANYLFWTWRDRLIELLEPKLCIGVYGGCPQRVRLSKRRGAAIRCLTCTKEFESRREREHRELAEKLRLAREEHDRDAPTAGRAWLDALAQLPRSLSDYTLLDREPDGLSESTGLLFVRIEELPLRYWKRSAECWDKSKVHTIDGWSWDRTARVFRFDAEQVAIEWFRSSNARSW
jgi:hypothetical protein